MTEKPGTRETIPRPKAVHLDEETTHQSRSILPLLTAGTSRGERYQAQQESGSLARADFSCVLRVPL